MKGLMNDFDMQISFRSTTLLLDYLLFLNIPKYFSEILNACLNHLISSVKL